MGCVIGVESYKHSAAIYQASGSGESASEALRRRAMLLMASSFVPMPDNSHFQNGNIIHGAGPNGGSARGDSVAAVWPGLSLIRDPFSKASQGVVLTWVALWDAQTAHPRRCLCEGSFPSRIKKSEVWHAYFGFSGDFTASEHRRRIEPGYRL